ncbi:hypothetical protein PAESOLCIP111_06734 [Paenibacillus solanacearum]|uniref:Uncharacterized protein n=1 Tax=Paenibacillus solanacearum TaxID=2048548 RepID=A0A916NM23_9BACL|nr:hypothetical protein [Paenibacillus solanacearum]CAG7653292.1 hypothetical protein PAESOLCIP111_06734 [Paenibacillus solanacearum]
MDKEKAKLKMTTQMSETPTLYGEDARRVLEEIKRIPTKEQLGELNKKYNKLLGDVQRTR